MKNFSTKKNEERIVQDLVSIIVPVFNVENYLGDCIESILKQTYTFFELILVDDGSTDSSYKICEEYAATDKRIKLYKKENGGLSDARNYGLDHAKGKYVTFIDSDDYVENNFVEALYYSIQKNSSDIAVAAYRRVTDDGDISYDIKPGEKSECWSNIDALILMLYQKIISISACSKLYSIELFNEIRFPKGKLYEDILTVPQLFLNAKKISYENKSLLNYRIRKGSITASTFKAKDVEMLENSIIIRDNFIQLKNLRLSRSVESYIFSKASTLLFLVEGSNWPDKKKIMNLCWNYIKKYRYGIMGDRNSRKINRIGACLSFLGMTCYIDIYKKIKR